ncbi:MAG: hypothetical protein H0T62_00170 [Parachlamydiaceae bacterium]|nr:hypothetical protein [Parachlamydiaceae bacterium]
MQYTIEKVSHPSQLDMLNFVKEHEKFSLFLLGNLESYGATLTNAPFSGNYKLIRSFGEIVAVFSLTRKGSLQIAATVLEPIFQTVLEACQEEAVFLTGVVGNWNFCGPFW